MKNEEKLELLQQLYDQLRCTYNFDPNSDHMIALKCTIFNIRHRIKMHEQLKEALKTCPKF